MDFYRRHPFWTGVFAGLAWGAIRHPAALGCLLLILTGMALFAALAAWLFLLDWLTGPLLLGGGSAAAILWLRNRRG